MKELNFKRCFINGKKCGVANYDDGTSRVLFFSQSLGAGIGVEDLRAAGISCHQFNNSLVIPSADVAGIQSVIADAVVHFDGSKEFQALSAAAAGSRPGGGNTSGKTSAASSAASSAATEDAATATAAATLPAVDASGILSDALTAAAGPLGGALVASVLPVVNAWAAGLVNETAKASAGCKESFIHVLDASGAETSKIPGVAHKQLQKVVNLLKVKLNVYLYGPAGTGKTVLCEQAAAALSLPFYSDQRVGDTFTLSGFVDASGKYQETSFYRAFSGGGVYMLDEFDASDPNAVIWLNTALANGFATFPGVGRVNAAPDFICIAAGNTIGRGADSDYSGRCVLDAATLSRFAFVAVDYDEEIEKMIGGEELAKFFAAVRRACAACGVSLVAGTRELKAVALCEKTGCFEDPENLAINLTKGLEIDQISTICSAMDNDKNRWSVALRSLAV